MFSAPIETFEDTCQLISALNILLNQNWNISVKFYQAYNFPEKDKVSNLGTWEAI